MPAIDDPARRRVCLTYAATISIAQVGWVVIAVPLAALSAVVDRQGWTVDAALVGIAGMGLTFGMWWVYSLVPSAEILQRRRDRAST